MIKYYDSNIYIYIYTHTHTTKIRLEIIYLLLCRSKPVGLIFFHEIKKQYSSTE